MVARSWSTLVSSRLVPPVAVLALIAASWSESSAEPTKEELAVLTALARVKTENNTIASLNAAFDVKLRKPRTPTVDDRTTKEKAGPTPKGTLLRSLRGERDKLSLRESRLNRALATAYRAAARVPEPHRLAADARVGAHHFAVLWRRQSMRDWHTTVPGLTDDPDCDGDVMKDGLLEQYVDAYFQGAEARAAQFSLLARLSRQAACLSARQVNDLGKEAARAFDELARLHHSTGRDHTLALLVQMLAQPFVLFYDVDKYRKADSGWHQWFKKYEFLLREGLRAKRQALLWQGLWLYDRRTGRLVRFTEAEKPRFEGDIRLDSFFASLAQHERFGDGDCSLAEMVLRGNGSAGYSCLARECLRNEGTSVGGPSSEDTVTSRMSRLVGRDFSLPEVSCKSEGGPWEGKGRGNGGCDSVALTGARGREALTVECATKNIIRPGLEKMQCVSEATGACASPVDRYVKELQVTEMSGVKFGRSCGIAQGSLKGDKSGGVNTDRLILGVGEAILRHIKKEVTATGMPPEFARDDTMEDALRLLQEVKQAAENLIKDLEQQKGDLGAELLETEDPARQQDIERELDELQREINKLEDKVEELQDGIDRLEGNEGDDPVQPTTEDDTAVAQCASEEDCDDKCTGIERSMGKAVACFKDLDETQPDLTRAPAACDPRVCDPMEPGGEASARACLGLDDPTTEGTTPKHCWLYRCAGDQLATADGAGCRCGPNLPGSQVVDPVSDFCAQARCTGDSGAMAGRAALSGGSCGCAPDLGGGGTERLTSISVELLPSAPSILEVNPAARTLIGEEQPPGSRPDP